MAVWRRIRRNLRERISLLNKVAPSSADRKALTRTVSATTVSADHLVDAEWYAKTFGLSSPRHAMKHFRDIGSAKCYAIAPALAGADGRTLAPWAVGLLLQLGVRIGARPGAVLEPDDARAIRALSIPDHKKRRFAVVTTVFGAIDRLLPVFGEWLEDADFYAFVDQSVDDAIGWTLVHCNFNADDPRRRARFVKTHLPLYFSDYDGVLWIDANVFLCDRPSNVLEGIGIDDVNFAAFRHATSRSLVMEAADCIDMGKVRTADLFAQLKRLDTQSSIGQLPLFDTGVVFLRPQATAVRQTCAAWWREIVRGTNEDQLSLPVAIAENEMLAWAFAKESSVATSRLFIRVAHEKG